MKKQKRKIAETFWKEDIVQAECQLYHNKFHWAFMIFFIFFAGLNLPCKEISFFLNGGYTTGLQMTDFGYSKNWTSTDAVFFGTLLQGISGKDSGAITGSAQNGLNAFSGGVRFFLTSRLGISFSLEYFRQRVALISSSQTAMQWLYKIEGSSFSGNYSNAFEKTSTGKVSLIPFSLNLLYRLPLPNNFFLGFQAGPTLFLYELTLPAYIGGGSGTSMTYYLMVNGKLEFLDFKVYPDFFIVDASINRSSSYRLGGNIGLAIEKKWKSFLGFQGGLTYYYSPAKEYPWEVSLEPSTGQENKLIWTCPAADFRKGYEMKETKINFSYLRAFLGVVFYL